MASASLAEMVQEILVEQFQRKTEVIDEFVKFFLVVEPEVTVSNANPQFTVTALCIEAI
jgi:hypothetical protein